MSSPVLSLTASPLSSDADLLQALSEAIGSEPIEQTEGLTIGPSTSGSGALTAIPEVNPETDDFSDPFGPLQPEDLYPAPLTIRRWRAEQRARSFVPITTDTCWRCGKTGHQRGSCPNTALMFCSRCGRIGTLSRNCTCQGGITSRPRPEGPAQHRQCRPPVATTACPTCGCPNAVRRKLSRRPPPEFY